MIFTKEQYIYKAFGLKIFSEIPLPELDQVITADGQADIWVRKADLTAQWAKERSAEDIVTVKENFIMFEIPGTAIFLIKNGNQIFISPVAGSCEDAIRLYVLGTCMGAILLQRKVLPLHGSVIAIEGKAYAIVGDSGAGKSTLAASLLKKGYKLLSDDIIPVSFSEENNPLVLPTYPQQKLWQESLNQFGVESSQYKAITERETKFTIPVADHFINEPMPLEAVFELVKSKNQETQLLRIENMKRFFTLFNHTFRNSFVRRSGLMEWHFAASAKLVNKVDLYQLSRPVSRFTAFELTDLLLNAVKKGEKVCE
ncbi:aldolase [Domibacillus sp. PGB-M46]|uniref:aldolase n=1 Tax=Domibacillus sp. PGB-M46 TaxID=2910255 RepID=UPI001F56470E|nr:aldolase [Domibacillus sp. PGB-M46]MCI2255187.1 aldolase [Domibacillus sp. PGB-M46]